MDERQGEEGYERNSGSFGNSFISLGSSDEPPNSKWAPWNRRGHRGGFENRRGRGGFMERRGRNHPNSNDGFNRSSEDHIPPFYRTNQGANRSSEEHIPPFYRTNHGANRSSEEHIPPFYRTNPGPDRGGWGRGRGRGRGRGHGHQGMRQSDGPIPIDAYYHPSMMEDPWRDLENLLKGPSSNNVQCDEDKKNAGDEDSKHSEDDSEGSE